MACILVVDDESDIRGLVRLALQNDGTEIIEAASADEALAVLAAHVPDIVLLDVMMPGQLDGFALCRHIRSDPRLDATRVVMLTARGQRDDIQRGLAAGADHYLVKPFSPLALEFAISALTHADVSRHEDRSSA
jgi:DNA-binding response OmpR family regulator